MQVHIQQYDDDDPPHVQISISHDGLAGRQEGWISREQFAAFGRELQEFPLSTSHAIALESGSPKPRWACHILIRAFVRDGSGHAALEVRMSNNRSGAEHASVHFHIFCEAAALNRFGQSIECWARSDSREYEYLEQR